MLVNLETTIYSNAEKGMFEYELKFDPPVDSRDERFKLVNQLKEVF